MSSRIKTATPTGTEISFPGEASENLAAAIRGLGADERLRDEVVRLCRTTERRLGLRHGDVRETITGPIIDALHAPGMPLRKELANGLLLDFTYRSKIARDFVLSPDVKPDHVWEPQTSRLLVHLARRARHVVIGGGYIGDQAILVAHALQERGGWCHAFEPNRETAGLMRRNASQNAIGNLRVCELGLWSADDQRLMLVGNDSHAQPVPADEAKNAETIATIRLETYGKREGIDRLDLLMLDIEGGEHAALEGAAGFLHRPQHEAPAVVFEIHSSYVDWSHGLAETPPVRFMLEAGYQVFAIRDFQSNVPMERCLIELLPLDAVHLEGPPHGFNMLAVKDAALIDSGLFRLCRDKSPKLLLYKAPNLHHPTEWLTTLPEWLRSEQAPA